MMETFAEAWVAANVQTPLTEAAEQVLHHTATHPVGRTSIPVHCIVERISPPGTNGQTTSPASSSSGTGDASGSSSAAPATPSPLGTTSSANIESNPSSICQSSVIEQDSYAIMASDVLFVDLVRTALLKLGYTAAEAVGAKGMSSTDLSFNA